MFLSINPERSTPEYACIGQHPHISDSYKLGQLAYQVAGVYDVSQ